jgi:hypothetical protein
MSSRQFWLDRITRTKELIIAWEEAESQLSQGSVQSYTIDTGQTRQTVTRADLSSIRAEVDSLMNRLVTLEARLGLGGAVINVRPGW